MIYEKAHPALWWEPAENDKLLCTLCPRYCTVGNGQHGFCYIRKNIEGSLYAIGYGRPTGFAIDPIEKKPLFHFHPGSEILSFGTAGCNLGCKFCQNWSISKAKIDQFSSREVAPKDVVQLALRNATPSIAFTYNDPVIFGEYVMDISEIAAANNINTVMVTAGYIDSNARKDVFKNISAANVDLKGFSERFYRELTGTHLEPVLDTLKWLKHETDIWFEITTLIIPGENDDEDELKRMFHWIVTELGPDVPLHLTAFHPDFKLTDKPATSPVTLKSARRLALASGINYVYTGNIHNTEGETTYCPGCKAVLITRNWHTVTANTIKNGCCTKCNTRIAGRF